MLSRAALPQTWLSRHRRGLVYAAQRLLLPVPAFDVGVPAIAWVSIGTGRGSYVQAQAHRSPQPHQQKASHDDVAMSLVRYHVLLSTIHGYDHLILPRVVFKRSFMNLGFKEVGAGDHKFAVVRAAWVQDIIGDDDAARAEQAMV